MHEVSERCYNKSSAVADMGDRLATIDMGQKVGGLWSPFREEGELGTHLTQWGRGLPPYQVAFLIYPIVWPQYTNVTDRTDNGLIP